MSTQAMNGEQIGGQTLTFGLSEDCVGIPEEHKNMPEGVYEATMEIAEKIKSGEIQVPASAAEYEQYRANQ